MPQPTSGDVHVNTPLTNISVAFEQSEANFVSAKVFPMVPVMKQSDRYYTYDQHFFNRDEMKQRAPATESAGGGYEVDNTPNYFCNKWSFHKDVDEDMKANADSVIGPDRDATQFCTMKGLIRREKQWVTNYLSASLWGRDRAGVASGATGTQYVQFDQADSDPIITIRGEKTYILQNTGFVPNTLVMGVEVWDAIVDNPQVIDRIKYGQTAPGPAITETAAFAALVGIPNIYVMKSIESTALEGNATQTSAFIGGKKMLLCYSAPSPGLMTPTGGYTFVWTGLLGGQAAGMRMKKFYMAQLEADRVEITMAFDQKLIAASLGTYFSAVVA